MVIAKKYVLVKHFQGVPKSEDLKIVEEELPPIKDGEYLVEAEYFSVDPYMRLYIANFPVGSNMIGSQVAKVIESKNPKFPVGARVVGYFGWRTHTIVNKETLQIPNIVDQKPYLLPDFGGLSPSLGLGVLGMPGNTAFFGLTEIIKPKAGETLVVSGAAGAVGSHAGQIGKILGLTVIGIAGSDEKCKWLKELGFDYTINYKTQNVAAELKKAAPNGIDCYFDNVGGEISSTVIYQLKLHGRVASCGSIASYNADTQNLPKVTIIQPAVVFSQLKIEGFIVSRWLEQWLEGINKNLQWIKQGKLKYTETLTEGFDNLLDAFAGMLTGQNTGKAIVKA